MKISFITTVLNEDKKILLLLDSLKRQTKKSDEIVIVDGGSRDKTVEVIKNWVLNIKSEEFKKRIKFLVRKGNRSVGRNEAIKKATGDIIVSSDAGCVLDKNWIKNIASPFKSEDVDVVSGFYRGISKNVFEKCLLPYVLVMPDKVNPNKFLPSARSMAFKKEIWNRVGGFPQSLSDNEDYVFARKLRRIGATMVFRRNAIVFYTPRENIFQAFVMFFRFAKGDAESGILRPKVLLILIRYIFLAWLFVYVYFFKLFFILETIFYILVLYIIWSIWKNYRYVKDREAFLILPLIQITSDLAVITGTIWGFLKSLWGIRKRR